VKILSKAVLVAGLVAMPSCQLLDGVIPVVDEEGKQTGTTTVGDVIADNEESASNVAGSVVGMLTGNPILGATAAAAAAGLFASARRKKQPQVETEA
jgi:hypothetical protein